jgi:hypothetical protein
MVDPVNKRELTKWATEIVNRHESMWTRTHNNRDLIKKLRAHKKQILSAKDYERVNDTKPHAVSYEVDFMTDRGIFLLEARPETETIASVFIPWPDYLVCATWNLKE